MHVRSHGSVCSGERRPGLLCSFPGQVHASCLASESSSRAVQAELALAKRDAAQAASALKSAMATWHAELEWQKAEVRLGSLSDLIKTLMLTEPAWHGPSDWSRSRR